MNSLDLLPDVGLGDSGAIGRRFLALGVMNFRAACAWVRDVPYGANRGSRSMNVVFDEMRGTCQSKHDLIAALAQELDLRVSKYVGGYRLDEAIIEGAGAVLAAHGIAYVPETHCVLKYDERFFDLTAGNRHGKKKDITDMDVYLRVQPFASRRTEQATYELCAQYYRGADPILGLKSVNELRRIATECRARNRVVCLHEHAGAGVGRPEARQPEQGVR